MTNTLNFAIGNAKLNKETVTFSLPAGHSCPFAKECRSSANRATGKVVDGEHCKFRCYAANAEALFGTVRKSRWHNLDTLKLCGDNAYLMADIIDRSIPRRDGKTEKVRIHQSGDFFKQAYLDAWLLVARQNPDLIFYGYTKALPLFVKHHNKLPDNFRVVASLGGTHDHLIPSLNFRSARVVFSEYEAKKLRLEIDHDDSHCWNSISNFAVLIHGTQPAGSGASKAWQRLMESGKSGYKSGYFNSYKKSGKTSRTKIKIGNGLVKAVHITASRKKVSTYA
jgi:hypothetical protein